MSNIYFKNIKLNNFMSYERAEVPLDKHGYILVNGENNNPADSASSNGCGKSTIFNAISWVLTGQTISGAKDVSNIITGKSAEVELDFDCNNKNYIIKRSKSPSKLKIFVDGEDKSGKGIRDTEKLLNEYLPDVTDSLLNSVIILGQGLPQRFTNNTPAGRKEVLETLSKSDFMIDDIKVRLNKRKEYLDLELRKYEDKLLTNNHEHDIIKHNIADTQHKLDSLEDESELISRLNDITNLSNSYQNKIDDCKLKINELQLKIDSITSELTELYSKAEVEKNNLVLEDTSDLEQLIFETNLEIKNKEQEADKLDSVTDICPTCGQKLPDIHKIDTSKLRDEIHALKLDLADYTNSLNSVKTENNNLLTTVDNKYKELNSQLNSTLLLYKDQATTINKEYSNTQLQLQDTNSQISIIQTKLDNLEYNRITYNNDLNKFNDSLSKIESDNVVINNNIDNIKNHIDINHKMFNIVKRDFRGYLLINVIDFISERCKYYSSQVFGTDNLIFELSGNNISITYDNKEYEMLSGGEKQKVDIILQLSIRDMLCTYLNFSSNILVLDEITDSLDIIGAQKIFNLISNNLTDVETIYIISHHKDFEIPYDDEIRIIKGDDKISRIV